MLLTNLEQDDGEVGVVTWIITCHVTCMSSHVLLYGLICTCDVTCSACGIHAVSHVSRAVHVVCHVSKPYPV